MRKKAAYNLHQDPHLDPLWKEVINYPAYFFRELASDMRDIPGRRKEFSELIKEEFYRFFDMSGDWVVKVYVLFVLVILPLLMNALLGPYFKK